MRWADPVWEGYYWLGHGMGSSGVIYRLLKIPEIISNDVYRHHIDLTLEYWMNRQDMTSG